MWRYRSMLGRVLLQTRSARKEPVVHTGLRALSYARCGGSGSNSCTSEIIILSKCRAYSRRAMNILEVVEACNAGFGRHVRGLCEDLASQGHRLTMAYSPLRADEAFQRFVGGWQDTFRSDRGRP
jgi:hypothetical protein